MEVQDTFYIVLSFMSVFFKQLNKVMFPHFNYFFYLVSLVLFSWQDILHLCGRFFGGLLAVLQTNQM